VAAEAIDGFLAHAKSLPQVLVSDADLSTVYRWGDGGLSPLLGPMDSATYNRVLDESVIEHGGKLYAWTIPLALPVTEALARRLRPGQQAAITTAAGEIVAVLDITDVYAWDKKKYLSRVYLTDRTDHPGGDMVLKSDADKTHLLGGTIEVLPQPKDPRFAKYVLSPREVRKLLAEKGWQRVVAFQTRNPLHRAHEYALVYGLETLVRAGHNAGACLNPLIGETKGDDVDADVRMHTYEALIKNRAKEAVMHAIYRQNFGFTDIIIGRKHADAPYHDGKPIWGDFDAQKIFDHLAGDLKIHPLRVGFAAFYQSIGRVDLMDNHKDEKPVFISGKEVRNVTEVDISSAGSIPS
jgi:sulfate adenylyltransferase